MAYRLSRRPSVDLVKAALRRLAVDGTVGASTRAIAKEAGVSHWSVRQAIDDLEGLAVIRVLSRGRARNGPGFGGRYRLTP